MEVLSTTNGSAQAVRQAAEASAAEGDSRLGLERELDRLNAGLASHAEAMAQHLNWTLLAQAFLVTSLLHRPGWRVVRPAAWQAPAARVDRRLWRRLAGPRLSLTARAPRPDRAAEAEPAPDGTGAGARGESSAGVLARADAVRDRGHMGLAPAADRDPGRLGHADGVHPRAALADRRPRRPGRARRSEVGDRRIRTGTCAGTRAQGRTSPPCASGRGRDRRGGRRVRAGGDVPPGHQLGAISAVGGSSGRRADQAVVRAAVDPAAP